ncbi:MAG: DUF5069 domain-containing protein [Opitutaceae bacterium]|nr:DUF5069 domain-containing protein [Opitutaceae bacterium]
MNSDNLKLQAKNLAQEFPRSPRTTLAGYVHAARMLDKCRAVVAGTAGEYHFNCPLDRYLLDFTGIDAEAFRAFVATGADDTAVAAWIAAHSKIKDDGEVVAWNNKMRDMRLSEMPLPLQVFLEGYIPKFIPANRPVRVWFDVYDLEEKRM